MLRQVYIWQGMWDVRQQDGIGLDACLILSILPLVTYSQLMLISPLFFAILWYFSTRSAGAWVVLANLIML